MPQVRYVINKAHSLMVEQEQILNSLTSEGDDLIRVDVPEEGLTLEEQIHMAYAIMDEMNKGDYLVFVSPVPCMVGYVTARLDISKNMLIFGNDTREKKELPNGRIVQVISKTGWYLFNPITGTVV